MEKNSLRRKHRGQRVDRNQGDEICRRIVELEAFRKAEKVLVYSPLHDEIDIVPLLEEKKKFYFPKLEDGRMVFTLYTGVTVIGSYGLDNATGPVLENFDNAIAIVPGLSFDAECYRLGRGGGFYDRFLQSHPELFTIGVQTEENLESILPHDSWDVRMKCVLTEKSVYVS